MQSPIGAFALAVVTYLLLHTSSGGVRLSDTIRVGTNEAYTHTESVSTDQNSYIDAVSDRSDDAVVRFRRKLDVDVAFLEISNSTDALQLADSRGERVDEGTGEASGIPTRARSTSSSREKSRPRSSFSQSQRQSSRVASGQSEQSRSRSEEDVGAQTFAGRHPPEELLPPELVEVNGAQVTRVKFLASGGFGQTWKYKVKPEDRKTFGAEAIALKTWWFQKKGICRPIDRENKRYRYHREGGQERYARDECDRESSIYKHLGTYSPKGHNTTSDPPTGFPRVYDVARPELLKEPGERTLNSHCIQEEGRLLVNNYGIAFWWIAMELMQETVSESLDKSFETACVTPDIFFEKIRGVGKQVVGILKWLREKHIVHRDLKLQNLMYGRDKKIYIIDMGLATQIPGTNVAQAGTKMFKSYRAGKKHPEPDYRDDYEGMLWSLFWMLLDDKERLPWQKDECVQNRLTDGTYDGYKFTDRESREQDLTLKQFGLRDCLQGFKKLFDRSVGGTIWVFKHALLFGGRKTCRLFIKTYMVTFHRQWDRIETLFCPLFQELGKNSEDYYFKYNPNEPNNDVFEKAFNDSH